MYYNVSVGGPVHDDIPLACIVELIDKEGNFVGREKRSTNANDFSGMIRVAKAQLWWPYLMHPNPGYMYTLQVENISSFPAVTLSSRKLNVSANEFQVQIFSKQWGNDVYRLPIGIRILKWNNASFGINDKPVYMRGFGRHEDSDASIFLQHFGNRKITS